MRKFFVKNSKEVQPGDTFFSIAGMTTNGNLYIHEAIEKGAIEIVVQKDNIVSNDIINIIKLHNVSLRYVNDIYLEFSKSISNYFKNLISNFTFIGVTGTKGKTTTVNAIFNLIRILGYSCGMMSSAYHKINENKIKSSLTTEMINDIYCFLEKAKQNNVNYIILEVSAHAFTQYRIYGILFDAFIFTNFSQDHGETYSTQDEYFKTKCDLYNYIKPHGLVILNKDDEKVMTSIQYAPSNIVIKTYSHSMNFNADIMYSIEKDTIHQSQGALYFQNNTYLFFSSWIGLHNIGNIAAAFLVLNELFCLHEEQIILLLKQIKFFPHIPGRNEKYYLKNNKTVFIEKAYTPNSVHSTLKVLKDLASHMTVLFGCGGNKDIMNRPILAKIIEDLADTIYVSTDNPRNESINNIFFDIAQGFSYKKEIHFIQDRKIAIQMAIEKSPIEGIIVLLGKGDEEYQLINGIKYPFSESNIIAQYI